MLRSRPEKCNKAIAKSLTFVIRKEKNVIL